MAKANSRPGLPLPKFTSSLSGVDLLAAPGLNLDGFADLVIYQFCSGICSSVSHTAGT